MDEEMKTIGACDITFHNETCKNCEDFKAVIDTTTMYSSSKKCVQHPIRCKEQEKCRRLYELACERGTKC